MTGSGKTGLGIVLLEEALGKGIPALILDPKGDMGNLALTFPDLSAASFRPWIDESAARDAGQTPDEYAAEDGRALAERPRAFGNRPGPDQGAARRRRGDALHARLRGRRAAERDRLAEGAEALVGDRRGDDPGRDRGHRLEPARPGRDRGRPDRQPRARPPLEPARAQLARGNRSRSRRPDRTDPEAAAAQARRLRDRRLHAAGRPERARDQAERARRLAVVRRLGPRAGARPRRPAPRPRTAGRAPRSSTSPTSRTRSGSSSSRSCSRA